MDRIAKLKHQEEVLQFSEFPNEEAWKLGCYMRDRSEKKGIQIGICIRLNSGLILFQSIPNEVRLSNQEWMYRKFNLVRCMERSSLMSTWILEEQGQSLADHGLNDAEYVLCGGGFPIRLKNAGIIGAVTVSALPHEEDHAFIVECLAGYLNADADSLL